MKQKRGISYCCKDFYGNEIRNWEILDYEYDRFKINKDISSMFVYVSNNILSKGIGDLTGCCIPYECFCDIKTATKIIQSISKYRQEKDNKLKKHLYEEQQKLIRQAEERANRITELHVKCDEDQLKQLKAIFHKYPGDKTVRWYPLNLEKSKVLDDIYVSYDSMLRFEVGDIIGFENIKYYTPQNQNNPPQE